MTQICICSEGILHLPVDAKSQTLNIITLASGQAVNISRDYPVSGMDFEQYLQGQLKILASKCKNYQQLSLLAADPTAVFSKVVMLTFSFMPVESITCWQYIVLAERVPGNIMLFSSLFKDKASLDAGSIQLNSLFENFRAH
ncbi:DcrB-related protein [Dryocola sp. BD613]|uniref:DcrB-related protein n=1 Tax=Dryocola sp. BD613 TaxID=3133272 RepID=UPI003F4F4946